MTGKTHFGIGIISTVVLSQYLSYDLSLGALMVCSIASLLPDIDHPKGIINKYLLPLKNKQFKMTIFFVIGIFLVILNYFYFDNMYINLTGIFIILIGFSSHRDGTTHSFLGLFCFAGVFGVVAMTNNLNGLIVPFIIGYMSHLIADMFTKRGVMLLYPFISRKFRTPITFSVGSVFGNIIEGIIISSGLLYILFNLPQIITRFK
jgi:inner membrane protein